MLPNEDLVELIWSHSRGEFAFQSTKFKGKWTDHPVTGGEDLPIEHQPAGHDLYFSALVFSEARRSNDTFAGASLLFADLDPVNPEILDITPSVAWETSPESYQAVWFLDEVIEDYETWANLNQRMTRYTEADPGGWMGSKALRWPGSLNWKRAKDGLVPVGRVIWADGPTYTVEVMQRRLPAIESKPAQDLGDHPDTIHPSLISTQYRSLRRKHWHAMGLRSRSMVSRGAVPDRSLFLAQAARNLLKDGLAPEDVFHLLWVQPYCKWRTDRDAPHVLWHEIQKAAGAL